MRKEVKKEEVKKAVQPTTEEILESLKIQLEQHKNMALKAQGAIEVLEQLNEGELKEN